MRMEIKLGPKKKRWNEIFYLFNSREIRGNYSCSLEIDEEKCDAS